MRRLTGRAALLTAVALVGAVALYASALGLWAWADDLDNTARVRAYSTAAPQAPIDRCWPGRVTWSCLP